MRVLNLIWASALAVLALCLAAVPGLAQTSPVRAIVVDTCGGITLPLNDPMAIYQDKNGRVCFAGALVGGAGSQEQDVRATATLNAAAANAAVTLPINGQATVGLAISGLTASGATVTFEQSNDGGTTWTGVNEVNAGTGVPSGTRSIDGQTRIAVQARTAIRIRVSTTGAGTITVASNISVREGIVALAAPVPPGDNAIGGTAATPLGGTPSTYRIASSAASTNAALVATGPLRVFGVFACNTTGGALAASPGYVKLYDKASAPVVGTDIPRTVRTWVSGACAEYRFGDVGIQFASGLALSLSNNNADTSTSAVGADAFQQVTIEYRR